MNSMSGEKLKGIPYTGTLPAVITGTKAGYLHSYKIYGNTEQTGTPTPENPIVPSECGERTENLINVQPFTIEGDGRSHYISLWFGTLQVGIYTISLNQDNNLTSALRNTIKITIGGTAYHEATYDDYHLQSGQHKMTFTISDSSQSVEIQYWGNRLGNDCSYSNIMLTSGSTALPYEPYGYKLPLLSGSTPVDIYLGESQTTRQIKKLVLTGEEVWRYESSQSRFNVKIQGIKSYGLRLTKCYCSHYPVIDDGRDISNVPNNSAYTGGSDSTGALFYIYTNEYASVSDFKQFLVNQYENGTPVTIWYPLTTPTTAAVNEPLRKIGDYADTIDSTLTSAQIPTSAGSTTISWAGQGLAPSQFDSIQEWVDIPTYKRVNGEWVEDN